MKLELKTFHLINSFFIVTVIRDSGNRSLSRKMSNKEKITLWKYMDNKASENVHSNTRIMKHRNRLLGVLHSLVDVTGITSLSLHLGRISRGDPRAIFSF